ncbi:MAG: hypothetical protein ACKVP3_07950 [Hyphomicrobiaceae bacterium]
MSDDTKKTLGVFAKAVRDLLRDKALADIDPGEPAIVGRLRDLVRDKYEGWSIDTEWDRYEQFTKRLDYELSGKGRRIIPDLIVHIMGRKENLLVVEVKKAANKNYDGDIWKLKGMTEVAGKYAYSVGLHLVLDVKNGTAPGCDVYVDAAVDKELTEWMRSALDG